MASTRKTQVAALSFALSWAVFWGAATAAEKNHITGEVKFEGVTYVEKKAGIWIDGQYAGYLKELKGKKKIVLMPGDHEIVARRSGYDDFAKKIVIEPGQNQTVRVLMYKTRGVPVKEKNAKLKFSVKPKRAAVFVDDQYVGPASEFDGSMKVAAGWHTVKIELPGYRTYETSVDAIVGKKVKVKAELPKGSIHDAGPLIRAKVQ